MIDWNYVISSFALFLIWFYMSEIARLTMAYLDYNKRVAEGRAELERIKREIAEDKARMLH